MAALPQRPFEELRHMPSIPTFVPTHILIELLGADACTGDLIERHTNTETGSSRLVQVSVLEELPENFEPFPVEVDEEPFEFNGYDGDLDVPSYYGCDVD
jgi:hypothetical protein